LALDRDHVRRTAHGLAEQGQFELALAEYRKLLAEDPNDTRTLLIAGDLQVRAGDARGAIETYHTVSEVYAAQGHGEKAVAVLHQVRQLLTHQMPALWSHYAHVPERLVSLLLTLGRTHDALGVLDEEATRRRTQGNELEAVEIYRHMTEVAAGLPLPHLRLAEGLCRTGKVEEAIPSFRAAAELLRGAGRREDSLRVVERILHFKQDATYAKIAAELYLESGDTTQAMQALSRLQICFQADPSDLGTLKLLAQAFLVLDQEDKAIEVQKELARQAHEQGDKATFQGALAELKQRAPSDDQVVALTLMPPPGGESIKPGTKRRAAPKRPNDPSVTAVSSSTIPPNPAPERRSAPGVPSKPNQSRPAGPPRVPPRVPGGNKAPSTPSQSQVAPPARAEGSELGLDRPALAPEPSSFPAAAVSLAPISEEVPLSLQELVPLSSERPEPRASDSSSLGGQQAIARVLTDAQTYRDLGLGERAIEVLRKALKDFQDSIEIRELLRDTLAETGNTEGAIEEMLEIAQVYLAHEQEEHAETVLRNVLEAAPKHKKARALLAQLGRLSALPPEGSVPSDLWIPDGAPRLPSNPWAAQASAPGASAPSTRQSVLPPLPNPPMATRSQAGMMPPPPSTSGSQPPSVNFTRPSLDQILEQAESFALRGEFERAESVLLDELHRLPGHPLLTEALEEIRDQQQVASRPPQSAPISPRSVTFGALAGAFRPSRFSISPGSLLAPSSPSGVSLQTQLSELDAAVRESQIPPDAPFASRVDVDTLFEKFKEGVRAQVAESDSATHYDLGLAYKEMNLLDDAIEELQLAARDVARESVCFSTIALIYREQRMFPKALDFFKRGLASPNRLPEQEITLHYEIGDVSELCGMPEQALEHFEEVVSRNPSFRDVRDRIVRLKLQLRQSSIPASSSRDDDIDRAFKSLLGD
jgi:tetratricopeptide (TPR) repeat protein